MNSSNYEFGRGLNPQLFDALIIVANCITASFLLTCVTFLSLVVVSKSCWAVGYLLLGTVREEEELGGRKIGR